MHSGSVEGFAQVLWCGHRYGVLDLAGYRFTLVGAPFIGSGGEKLDPIGEWERH